MRVISIVSGKGGVGKTTIVANLGIMLASRYNKKVIVIDCNITTPHLGLYMGIHNHQITLNDLVKDNSKISDAIYTHASGVKVIPASLSLKDLDGLDMLHLKKVIDRVKEEYSDMDYILLDCAPGFGREALAGMRSGDEILYVTTPYFPVVVDIIKCVSVADDLDMGNIGLIVNMCKGDKHELSLSEIENITELPIITSLSLHNDVLKSLHNRIPITVGKPYSKISKQFNMLSSVITDEAISKDKFLDSFFGLFDKY